MHRSQILLETWQYETLKVQAERQGKSISEVVRDIVSRHLSAAPRGRRQKLRAVEGMIDDGEEVARNHDRYLYGGDNLR
jgi:plasmid stability protein